MVDATWGRDRPVPGVEAWKRRYASAMYFDQRLNAADPDTTFFLAGPPAALDGMAALRALSDHCYISDIYVARRGHGVGRRLLRHALGQARRRGLAAAVADVFEGNAPALGLFEAEGFALQTVYREPLLELGVLRLGRSL